MYNIAGGGGPTTIECYSEAGVNYDLLDYDYSGILSRAEGPIEIYVDGQYQSLCNVGWDVIDARALCRQLVGTDNGM